mmetsp:Transcript_93124/g.268987  ORF Transcript_93124/g.268987 Transcript_93124/m.268987 type:complete len:276 (+) Transcript_93124:351-1178(+)
MPRKAGLTASFAYRSTARSRGRPPRAEVRASVEIALCPRARVHGRRRRPRRCWRSVCRPRVLAAERRRGEAREDHCDVVHEATARVLHPQLRGLVREAVGGLLGGQARHQHHGFGGRDDLPKAVAGEEQRNVLLAQLPYADLGLLGHAARVPRRIADAAGHVEADAAASVDNAVAPPIEDDTSALGLDAGAFLGDLRLVVLRQRIGDESLRRQSQQDGPAVADVRHHQPVVLHVVRGERHRRARVACPQKPRGAHALMHPPKAFLHPRNDAAVWA